jgi:hypothetical protein
VACGVVAIYGHHQLQLCVCHQSATSSNKQLSQVAHYMCVTTRVVTLWHILCSQHRPAAALQLICNICVPP